MKNINLKKELVNWVLIIIPLLYLRFIWEQLPAKVPVHFNINGVADNWSGKNTLIFMPGLLTLGIYLLFLIIPAIDPKRKIKNMGNKLEGLRLSMVLFFSLLSLLILYSSKTNNMAHMQLIYVIMGLLFVILGNYMPALKPNYFIGIRTPWTLENETVWKKTHRLGSKLWVPGGILTVVISFIFKGEVLSVLFFCIIGIMALVPATYSYFAFRTEKAN